MTGNARGSVKITFSFVAVVNPIALVNPIRNGLMDAPKPVVEKEPAPFAIDIYIKSIGNDDVNAVNARELWVKLGVGRDFSNWIKDRIGKYDFLEGTDYAVAKIGERESSGFQPIDYFISLDMAKELSMVENNDQGKSARRYFIECEKQAKTITPKIDHLSTEIAALCEKRHDHVIRDIEVIIKQLENSPNLGSGFKSSTYLAGNGKQEKCYELDYEATMIVLTGYDVVARAKVIKRWQELEKSAPKLEQPTAQLFVPSYDGDLPDAVCKFAFRPTPRRYRKQKSTANNHLK